MNDTTPSSPGAAPEPRIVVETGLEARVAAIVEPAANQIGYRLVRVKLSQMNGLTLQVMAERPDGTMSVDDCEALSRALSPVLDVADPIDREYHLEVSSPGIDRPLVRRSDFETWRGHVLKLEASRTIDNRKRWRGRIGAVGDAGVIVERDAPPPNEAPTVLVPFDAVADARLVLTDELIEAALKADKAARRGGFKAADNDNDEDDVG